MSLAGDRDLDPEHVIQSHPFCQCAAPTRRVRWRAMRDILLRARKPTGPRCVPTALATHPSCSR